MSYGRFFAMIATSTVVMFGLMYLNTYLWTHVFWSETRAYMALLMGATMAIIMLGYMLSMYSSKMVNAAIFVGAAVVFAASLWLVRSQVTVGDTNYMRAMIPHHSIAIMTSSRANISDPRVRKLADEIIYAQDKEIAEMRYLVNDIDANGDAPAQADSGPAQIVSLDEALSTAEIAILDLEFLTREDIAQLFPAGAECTFTYTTTSKPALAIGGVDGGSVALAKISGDLVRLKVGDAGTIWGTEGISVALSAPDETGALEPSPGELQEADLVLELDAGLRAGYRGFYGCGA
ncbi:DUF305 domain-containing protein [Sedimentitalea sp. XS_ASV28]|uniref:DUF305 domain-containing protein n=1 Tax=Sedimentitalea sp. XS_ASV28 TaxID=3241296 RepID=UPI003514A8CB